MGPRTVVITLGSSGSIGLSGDELVRQPAHVVDVVDTTGAGDAFAGTLAATLAGGGTLQEGVQRAVVAGALACTKLGVVPSLATTAQIDALAGSGA
jgi:ribokinase